MRDAPLEAERLGHGLLIFRTSASVQTSYGAEMQYIVTTRMENMMRV